MIYGIILFVIIAGCLYCLIRGGSEGDDILEQMYTESERKKKEQE